MPTYRLTADAFVAGHRRRKGEIIVYDGPAGRAMEPVSPSVEETAAAALLAKAAAKGRAKTAAAGA